jgi:hypothetical protein
MNNTVNEWKMRPSRRWRWQQCLWVVTSCGPVDGYQRSEGRAAFIFTLKIDSQSRSSESTLVMRHEKSQHNWRITSDRNPWYVAISGIPPFDIRSASSYTVDCRYVRFICPLFRTFSALSQCYEEHQYPTSGQILNPTTCDETSRGLSGNVIPVISKEPKSSDTSLTRKWRLL